MGAGTAARRAQLLLAIAHEAAEELDCTLPREARETDGSKLDTVMSALVETASKPDI